MPSDKVKRKLLAMSQFQFGANGNTGDQVLFGSVTGCNPGLATVTAGTGSLLIPNLNAGDTVFLTPASMPSDMNLIAACATSASTVSASYYNSGSATINESTINFFYMAISPS